MYKDWKSLGSHGGKKYLRKSADFESPSIHLRQCRQQSKLLNIVESYDDNDRKLLNIVKSCMFKTTYQKT